ncbi:nucleoside-diphosphate kinase [Candidatus Fermentibacteria bacterium]|nr:nucleoside-diphosphate kinase [Candidatus Fermentibacteria bacterium]
MESTFVILKPNAVQRALVGEITSRFEKRGLRIAALKMVSMNRDLALRLYSEHEGKPFFADLIAFITSGPSVVMVLEAEHAVSIVRSMIGSTDPAVAPPGTIRGDYAVSTGHNMIHASDSIGSARREIEIFFTAGELSDYSLAVKPWL